MHRDPCHWDATGEAGSGSKGLARAGMDEVGILN